jgi:hypothetical protein
MTKITENDIELLSCNTLNVSLKKGSIKGLNAFVFSSFLQLSKVHHE